eukprot:sb/3472302/
MAPIILTPSHLSPQPIRQVNFLETVRMNHIGLESVLLDGFTLTGQVLVHNLSFEKTVSVRYTTDYWLSFGEVPATYSRSVAHDLDQFQFLLQLSPSLPPGARVELCLVSTQGGTQYWDNNSGRNYHVECAMLPTSAGFIMSDGMIGGRQSSAGAGSESTDSASNNIYY